MQHVGQRFFPALGGKRGQKAHPAEVHAGKGRAYAGQTAGHAYHGAVAAEHENGVAGGCLGPHGHGVGAGGKQHAFHLTGAQPGNQGPPGVFRLRVVLMKNEKTGDGLHETSLKSPATAGNGRPDGAAKERSPEGGPDKGSCTLKNKPAQWKIETTAGCRRRTRREPEGCGFWQKRGEICGKRRSCPLPKRPGTLFFFCGEGTRARRGRAPAIVSVGALEYGSFSESRGESRSRQALMEHHENSS